jgi:hypothetical protein
VETKKVATDYISAKVSANLSGVVINNGAVSADTVNTNTLLLTGGGTVYEAIAETWQGLSSVTVALPFDDCASLSTLTDYSPAGLDFSAYNITSCSSIGGLNYIEYNTTTPTTRIFHNDDDSYSCNNTTGCSGGLWINFGNVSSQQAIMSKWQGTGADAEWELYINASGNLVLQINDNANSDIISCTGATALSTNTWYYVLWSWDGGTASDSLKVWVNGSQDCGALAHSGSGFTSVANGAARLGIGVDFNAAGDAQNFLNGAKIVFPFYDNATSISDTEALRKYYATRGLVGQ